MANGKVEVSLVLNPLSKSLGAPDKDGKQKDATKDGKEHTLNMLFPGFDESKLDTWEHLASEIVRVGKQYSQMSEGASVTLKGKTKSVEKMAAPIRDHACKDEASFFPSDVCDSPEAFYALFVQGLRQAASTLAGNRIKSVWGPPSEGGTRGGPKSKSVDELD